MPVPLTMTDPTEIRARRDAKRARLLRWVKTEGFVDNKVAAAVIGTAACTASRALAAMVRDDLLRRHEVGRCLVWCLTPRGGMEAWCEGDDPLDLGFDGRVAETTLRHALACQAARLKAEAAGWREWQTDRQIRRQAAALREAKQASPWLRDPDAVAVAPGGMLVALELERSPKTAKQYAEIMSRYLQMRRAGTIEEVHYVAENARMASRLEGLFRATTSVRVKGTEIALKPEHHAVFRFFALDAWPPKELP